MSRPKSRKQRLEEFLRDKQPAAIGEREWLELVKELAPISENYLRELLQATGLPVAQPYRGVRLGSFEELESSLIDMEKIYALAVANKDAVGAKACRRIVIHGKDRARFISRNDKVDAVKRSQKAEMVEWILVWLENPGVFSSWAEVRRRMLVK